MAGSEHPRKTLDPSLEERIERLYEGYRSLDYYGVLDVGRDASAGEIKRAYHRLAKEFHPDKYLNVGSDPLKEKLNAVFSFINEAYRELMKGGGLSSRSAVPDAKVSRAQFNEHLAKERFKEGQQLFASGSYEEAAVLLGQAAYLDDTDPEYHYSYAMALIRNGKMKPAEEALKKAAQRNPLDSKYITELGYLYLELGFKARARGAFEKALKRDPSDEKAVEGMKLLGS